MDKPVKYKLVGSEELQGFMRDNMFDDEYSIHLMWKVYSDIMRRSPFVEEYKEMTESSLEKRLNEWASVKGGWLIRKGRGKNSIYYKRWFCRTDKSRAEVRRNVIDRLRSIKLWRK